MDIATEFGHMIDIIHCLLVDFDYLAVNLIFTPLAEHLELLMETDSWQLVSGRGSVPIVDLLFPADLVAYSTD